MKLLKQYRKKSKKTQADVAKAMKVDLQFVSNLEREVAPIPAKHFRTLNQTIGVPIKHLMALNVTRYIARMRAEMKRN